MVNDRSRRWLWSRIGLAVFGLLLILVGGVAGLFGWRLLSSEPQLTGEARIPGLSGPVSVTRDAQGVPTLTAASRTDLARGLGFLHGQERFFQMDLLRRAAAGEIGALSGAAAALRLDRRSRPHRFRSRAEATLAQASAAERELLDAYVSGVNAGLTSLGSAPFEYLLLRQTPQPWTAADTILAVDAMYLDLQDEDGRIESSADLLRSRLGESWAAFLNPVGTFLDAPLDGSRLPDPALPTEVVKPVKQAGLPANLQNAEGESAIGSNAWGVGGSLTTTGAALVAVDMHLGLRLPNTWYRARLVEQTAEGRKTLDITGVTLPGTPLIVAGSNGRIAWGFTNSYIDTGDSIILEPVPGQPESYLTPDGPRPLTRIEEQLCAGSSCETLVVEETIWGPVVGRDSQGRRLARRWVAHDPDAVRLAPSLALEKAGSVAEAVAIAHTAGLPQQNLVVGDRDGNIAWTLIGRVPQRFGFDGRSPVSWADGTRGWSGWLPPGQVPVVLNPADGRIWTANARILGGNSLAVLGDGGYAGGMRAGMIRHRLLVKDRFVPQDHLDIQLDDRGLLLIPWQAILQKELQQRAVGDVSLVPFLDPVRDWGGRAVPNSIGYRLVRTFRSEVLRLLYSGYLGQDDVSAFITGQSEGPALRLLTDRTPALVPAGYPGWDALFDAAIAGMAADVKKEGGLSAYSWGARNRPGIRHPLAQFVPLLSSLTDPPDRPLPGDTFQPRVQGRGFGASERFAVSPGHEEQGLFHMPGGQSGHPLSPYYLAGHDDWRDGKPAPFLPGAPRWTLTLTP
jgi:penicillin G amidase